ncbi:12324_t:CDS:2 [Ambispora gerdemannii]|uniref:12324_t:CDS:1 n=1 Tax=Ambispora gerdemannii TaxID=144530 RepID=A0A9N9C5V7_9GLOM|nr:12324_t:CDS:2 [Ambispora gerdemannii]
MIMNCLITERFSSSHHDYKQSLTNVIRSSGRIMTKIARLKNISLTNGSSVSLNHEDRSERLVRRKSREPIFFAMAISDPNVFLDLLDLFLFCSSSTSSLGDDTVVLFSTRCVLLVALTESMSTTVFNRISDFMKDEPVKHITAGSVIYKGTEEDQTISKDELLKLTINAIRSMKYIAGAF